MPTLKIHWLLGFDHLSHVAIITSGEGSTLNVGGVQSFARRRKMPFFFLPLLLAAPLTLPPVLDKVFVVGAMRRWFSSNSFHTPIARSMTMTNILGVVKSETIHMCSLKPYAMNEMVTIIVQSGTMQIVSDTCILNWSSGPD